MDILLHHDKENKEAMVLQINPKPPKNLLKTNPAISEKKSSKMKSLGKIQISLRRDSKNKLHFGIEISEPKDKAFSNLEVSFAKVSLGSDRDSKPIAKYTELSDLVRRASFCKIEDLEGRLFAGKGEGRFGDAGDNLEEQMGGSAPWMQSSKRNFETFSGQISTSKKYGDCANKLFEQKENILFLDPAKGIAFISKKLLDHFFLF